MGGGRAYAATSRQNRLSKDLKAVGSLRMQAAIMMIRTCRHLNVFHSSCRPSGSLDLITKLRQSILIDLPSLHIHLHLHLLHLPIPFYCILAALASDLAPEPPPLPVLHDRPRSALLTRPRSPAYAVHVRQRTTRYIVANDMGQFRDVQAARRSVRSD